MTDKTTKTNKQPGKIFRKGMGKKMKKKTTLKGLKIKTTKPTSDSKAKLTIKSTIKKKSKKPQTVVESAPIKSVTAGFIVESIFIAFLFQPLTTVSGLTPACSKISVPGLIYK